MMKNKYYLYRYLRNDINEPFYIGIGKKRDREFMSLNSEYERAYSKSNRNQHFLNIINKIEYTVEILFETNSLELIKEKEKEFISLYGRIDKKTGSLVNLTDGGDGHFNMSEENRKKLSELCTERFKDKTKPKEQLKKMSQWQIGKKLSTKTINKRTQTRKENAVKRGYYVSKEKIEKESKKLIQFVVEMNPIKEWVSISEILRKTNIKKGNIINVCKFKPKYKTAGGFIWRYKD
jgi:hypothetical protein